MIGSTCTIATHEDTNQRRGLKQVAENGNYKIGASAKADPSDFQESDPSSTRIESEFIVEGDTSRLEIEAFEVDGIKPVPDDTNPGKARDIEPEDNTLIMVLGVVTGLAFLGGVFAISRKRSDSSNTDVASALSHLSTSKSDAGSVKSYKSRKGSLGSHVSAQSENLLYANPVK